MRLIDADALIKAINEMPVLCRDPGWVKAAVLLTIDNAPIIQPDAPRVMTLDEVVAHYSLPPVFVDDFDAQEDYYEDIRPLYFEFPYQEEDPWIVHWRRYANVAGYLDEWKYTYNKKWRCWTARPTDEQRKAARWDG